MLGGDLSLEPGYVTELVQWLRQGGALMLAFTSQLCAVGGHEHLTGVTLAVNSSLVSVSGGFVEMQWHSTTPPVVDQQPFRSSQTAATTAAEPVMARNYSIKTVGMPSRRTGWGRGRQVLPLESSVSDPGRMQCRACI